MSEGDQPKRPVRHKRIFSLQYWKLVIIAVLKAGLEDANSDRVRQVNGDVWYATEYVYPNHWSQGTAKAVPLADTASYPSIVKMTRRRLSVTPLWAVAVVLVLVCWCCACSWY